MKFEGAAVPVPCLAPVYDHQSTIPAQLTKAYGGTGVDEQKMCAVDPHKVLAA